MHHTATSHPHSLVLIAAVLVALLGLAPSAATAGPPLELDAPYLAQPADGIATAGQLSEADLKTLSAAAFSAVINLRGEGERGNWDARSAAQELGLEYLHLPITGANEITFEVAQQLDQHLAGLQPTADRPVMIHCASSNRVGALLALRHFLTSSQPHEQRVQEALQFGRSAGLKSLEGRVQELFASREP